MSYKETRFPFGDKEFLLITKDSKIVLPKALQYIAVQWYHVALMHPGETQTELTIAQHYTWSGLRNTVKSVCQWCPSCQLTKNKMLKYGHVPPKMVEETPWERLCIDLIGTYVIGYWKNQTKLHCLTMIDPAIGLFKLAEISNKQADTVSNVLELKWLKRYP